MLLRTMVNKGYTVGYLSKSGSVSECDKTRYRPVQQKPQVIPTSGEETAVSIELTTTIPDGYFDKFTGEVTESSSRSDYY